MKRVLIVCLIVFMFLSVVLYFYDMYMFSVMRKNKKNKKKKTLSGFLAKYANSSLIEKEESAWFEEAKEWLL